MSSLFLLLRSPKIITRVNIGLINHCILLVPRRISYELEHVCSNVEQPGLVNLEVSPDADKICDVGVSIGLGMDVSK